MICPSSRPGSEDTRPPARPSRTARLIAVETLGRPVWTPRDSTALAREGYMKKRRRAPLQSQ